MAAHKRRSWICLAFVAIVMGWAVLAFGTVQDFVVDGDVIITADDVRFEPDLSYPVRSIAVALTGLGSVGCLLLLPGRRRLVRVPLLLAVSGGGLLVFGWFMVLNSATDYDSEGEWFVAIDRILHWDWAPGSIVRSASILATSELTVVLLAVLAAIRASEGASWRGLLAMLALLGGLVALVGLFHKAAHAPTVYWMEDSSQPERSFFAPYVYGANAGAFMNLCLPLAMGLALSAAGDERRRAPSIFWTLLAVLIASGVVVTASKGAVIVLMMTVPGFLLWNFRRLRELLRSIRRQKGRKTERIALVLTMAVLMLSLVATGLTYLVQRWDVFLSRFDKAEEVDLTGRGEIIKLMVRMAGKEEGGWHGFGPGTFKYLVPAFNVAEEGEEEPLREGVWTHGHCDPLQTAVEWGWLGAGAWVVIGIGAVISGFLLLRRKDRLAASGDAPLVRSVLLALVMVGIHSCLDFPLSVFSIHLAAMLLCGVLWGLYANRCRSAPGPPRR